MHNGPAYILEATRYSLGSVILSHLRQPTDPMTLELLVQTKMLFRCHGRPLYVTQSESPCSFGERLCCHLQTTILFYILEITLVFLLGLSGSWSYYTWTAQVSYLEKFPRGPMDLPLKCLLLAKALYLRPHRMWPLSWLNKRTLRCNLLMVLHAT